VRTGQTESWILYRNSLHHPPKPSFKEDFEISSGELHPISWMVDSCGSAERFITSDARSNINVHEWKRQICGLTSWWNVTLAFGIAMWYQSTIKWFKYKNSMPTEIHFWYVWAYNVFWNEADTTAETCKTISVFFISVICFVWMNQLVFPFKLSVL